MFEHQGHFTFYTNLNNFDKYGDPFVWSNFWETFTLPKGSSLGMYFSFNIPSKVLEQLKHFKCKLKTNDLFFQFINCIPHFVSLKELELDLSPDPYSLPDASFKNVLEKRVQVVKCFANDDFNNSYVSDILRYSVLNRMSTYKSILKEIGLKYVDITNKCLHDLASNGSSLDLDKDILLDDQEVECVTSPFIV